jgi:hypothetical protein
MQRPTEVRYIGTSYSVCKLNECKRQRLLCEKSIREVATKDCCVHRCCQLFPRDKMKAIREEMWLGGFRLRSSKKLNAHRAIHVNGAGRKVITLESINVCCTVLQPLLVPLIILPIFISSKGYER